MLNYIVISKPFHHLFALSDIKINIYFIIINFNVVMQQKSHILLLE